MTDLEDSHQHAGSRPRKRPTSDAVVITGAGLVTCLGLDSASTWSGVVGGRCGFGKLTAVESGLPPEKTGGQAPPLPAARGPNPAREVAYLRAAMEEALGEAGILASRPYVSTRCGIVLGTTLHGMRQAGRFLRTGEFASLGRFLAGSTLAHAAAGFGFEGVATTVCSACSSGLASITLAKTLLDAGVVDLVMAGGYDPISEYAYGGFNSMRLVTDGALRPFSRYRDGMKLGEGYAIVVLERRGDAAARGANPLAEIVGFGETCDAHHLSKPHPEGAGAVEAINAALRMGGIACDEIGLIAAHATATRDNDAAEFAALSRAFAGTLSDIPIVAFKSHVGHTLGGAGAVELVLSMRALKNQVVPPCATVTGDEVEFAGLRLAAGDPRHARVRHTLNTSLGFGGSNTCMVLKACRDGAGVGGRAGAVIEAAEAAERASEPDSLRERHVLITGIGVVLPAVIGIDRFGELLDDEEGGRIEEDTGTVPAAELDALLNARRARRFSDYVKLTLAATTLAYRDAGIEDRAGFGGACYAVLGTAHGSTAYSRRYYQQIVDQGTEAANPTLFAEGVPNAAAAHLSTSMSIKGLCQTVIGTRTAGLEALLLAAARIRTGVWERAIVGAADEYGTFVNDVYRSFSFYSSASKRRAGYRGFVTGCGAVTLILESADAARRRGATPWGAIEASSAGLRPRLADRSGVKLVRRIWDETGRPAHVIGSANDTWLDRVERRALTGLAIAGQEPPTVSSLYGHIAECFSAVPLASLAAVLVRGRLPRWRLGAPRRLRVALGDEPCERFGVLATDYAGAAVGVRIRRVPGRPME